MAQKKIVIEKFKQGDTFSVDAAVRDRKTNEAKIAAVKLERAQAAYEATLKADPLVDADVNAAYTDYTSAEVAYVAAITTDITDWVITCQVRHGQHLIDTMQITAVDALAGTYTIFATPAQTALWPATTLHVDVEFAHSSFGVSSTETFHIDVEKDITRA